MGAGVERKAARTRAAGRGPSRRDAAKIALAAAFASLVVLDEGRAAGGRGDAGVDADDARVDAILRERRVLARPAEGPRKRRIDRQARPPAQH